VPFPTFFPPVGSPAGSRRLIRRIVPLLLAAAVLAGCAVALGSTAGLAVLLVAASVLLAAAVVGLRAHWTETLAAEATPPVSLWPTAFDDHVPADRLTAQLQRLHERSAQDVTRALDDGRDALARELSDTYTDEALRAITTAGLPPAAPRA
jgi:hypothetical protein